MTLLVSGVVDLLDQAPTVLELGNQTFNADAKAFKVVLERLQGNPRVDLVGLKRLASIPVEERQDRVQEYYKLLGFTNYQAIDVNELYGSLVMDLNQRLDAAYAYRDTYSLITNNGTGEHVFSQESVFYNVHSLTRPGGLMLHSMPFVEYVNHGFYSFHPNLYYALARANHYRLLAMGVGTRTGYGIVAVPREAEEEVPTLLMEEQRVDLGLLLAEAKPPKRGMKGTLIGKLKTIVRHSDAGLQFHAALRRLQRRRPKLMLFVLMRKLKDAPFRVPMQMRYAGDISDTALREEYAGKTPESPTARVR